MWWIILVLLAFGAAIWNSFEYSKADDDKLPPEEHYEDTGK